MSTVARLLCDLIALPSVNPAFLPADDTRAGEHRVAEFVEHFARQAGLDVQRQTVLPGRDNVLVRLTPPGRVRQRVILAPHMDTVGGPPGDLAGLFEPVQRNGRIIGRGACDTKGSLASMLTALVALAGSAKRPAETEVLVTALVDEENNQLGSRALVKSGMKAALGIVGEPTRLQVITAHKGDLWLELETRGRAAHGAKPHLGVNAIHRMARVVDLLETRYAAGLKRRRHPVLGSPTINVGRIRGGTQPNIVPDRCVISIDRRTIPGESHTAVCREILAFLRHHGAPARLVDTKSGCPCPPMATDPGLPLVRQLLETTGQATGLGVDYFSDAAVLSGGGIPSVLFGPGDIAQAHTAGEWIAASQLDKAVAHLARFLRTLA